MVKKKNNFSQLKNIIMNYYKIMFTHRCKNYVALKRKAENEDAAIQSIKEQCEGVDRAKGNTSPVVITLIEQQFFKCQEPCGDNYCDEYGCTNEKTIAD
jgi:hypothetical protein